MSCSFFITSTLILDHNLRKRVSVFCFNAEKLKVGKYGKKMAIKATCIYNKNITSANFLIISFFLTY